jgi:YebC/PmpR family DNA-binding regulatory protein
MAGHSKWANIRHRKGKQDAIRGKLFTKLAREIIVAAKSGGGDPEMNIRLRAAIDKAKAASMPNDNIDRAVKRGTGEIEGENYEELMYEGYGPGGSGLLVEVYSDNRNRTVSDLRHAFSKHGGNMAENGAVSWQFKHVGQILVKKDAVDEETLTLSALENGAEDVQEAEDGMFLVETPIESLHQCVKGLQDAGIPVVESDLARVPTNYVSPAEGEMKTLVKLLDRLDELDDVKETYVNVDIPESVYEEA